MTTPITWRQTRNLIRVIAAWATGINLEIDPIQIDFEPTNRCNLRCRMCPNPVLTRPRGVLDPDLFRRVVEETAGVVLEYHLDMMGEPLLHPDLLSMIESAGRAQARVVLYTNFAVRNDRLVRSLARSPLDRILVNLSASDHRAYQQNHGKDRLDRVLLNLALFRAARGASRRPRLIVSWLDLGEPPVFDLADEVRVLPVHDWLGTRDLSGAQVSAIADPARYRCTRPWASLTILWDGRIATCCYDYEARRVLGDLRSRSVHEVWNSAAMREFRKRHRDLEPCRSCRDPDPQFSFDVLGSLIRNRLLGGRPRRHE